MKLKSMSVLIVRDIESQIDRADELLEELEASVKVDLNSKGVSEKTRNLTQEILVKMRSVFDQTMRKFYEIEIKPALSKSEIKKARVYFPIVPKQSDLLPFLGRGMMKDLDKTHSDVYSLLDSVQPYQTRYAWMEHFKKYANERHIRLTPQKRVESKRLVIGDEKTKISIGEGAKIVLGRGASIRVGGKRIFGGQTISTDSKEIRGDPGIARMELWVNFLFENSTINSLNLCKTVAVEGRKIVTDFLSKLA